MFGRLRKVVERVGRIARGEVPDIAVPGSQTKDIEIGGRKFRISGHGPDAYFQGFAATGVYTDDVTLFLKANVREGWVCFDIGANIGLTSVSMTTCAPGVRVFAFEPSPTTVEFLRHNVAANKLGAQIEVVPLAITDRCGRVSFSHLPESPAGSYIADTAREHPNAVGLAKTDVACLTLDEYLERHPVGRLDLLKIDVEGHEEQVLKGARAALAAFKPLTIVEFNGWFMKELQNDQRQHLLDVLFSTFDSVSRIDRNTGVLSALQNEQAARESFLALNEAEGWVDNLACRFEGC